MVFSYTRACICLLVGTSNLTCLSECGPTYQALDVGYLRRHVVQLSCIFTLLILPNRFEFMHWRPNIGVHVWAAAPPRLAVSGAASSRSARNGSTAHESARYGIVLQACQACSVAAAREQRSHLTMQCGSSGQPAASAGSVSRNRHTKWQSVAIEEGNVTFWSYPIEG